MFQHRITVIAAVLGAGLAIAQVAEAGGYAANKCISQKQGALGKYAKGVGKAWKKYPSDSGSRDAAIAKAFTKLDSKWTKAEEKAVKKNATCDEATSSSAVAAGAVDASFTDVTGDAALGDYIASAMKARSKYIKDPTKDPGKTKLEEGLDAADLKYLTGAAPATITEADELESALVELTTTAPDYPSSFQMITPGSSVVYGKETLTPTCVDGDPYVYFARRGTGGNENKVLMYYQGGGACWDKTSCFDVPGGTCARTADASDNPDLVGTGFADYDNPSNPFYGWSVVFVSYCTCDIHWGENLKVYGVGQTARHYGRVNAKVAEKFAREHFVDPDQVFVTGSSAGSYGAIMNSYWLMRDVWPNADYSVLGDAGVGVITKQWLDSYIENWGVENNFPDDIPGVSDKPVTALSLVDLVSGMNDRFPSARLANYDSSYDGGGGSQCNFFQVMRHPVPPNSFITDWTTWWEAACDWNACMREFKDENALRSSKYHYFTGAGTRHTIFGSDKVYTETKSTEADGTPRTFADWVQAMIDDDPSWVDVDCNNPGGDCNLTNSCQGGDTPGLVGCSVNADCGVGGVCEHDPDTANPPFNNDDTANCAPTTCPCGTGAATCFGGGNDGLPCASNLDCPSGTCSYVNCPTFTP